MACGGGSVGSVGPLNIGAAASAISSSPVSGMDFFDWIRG